METLEYLKSILETIGLLEMVLSGAGIGGVAAVYAKMRNTAKEEEPTKEEKLISVLLSKIKK